MLAAAIDDPAYAFLQGTVLLVDAVDGGVALGLLYLAVETVVVRPVLERTEGFRVDVQRTVAEAAFEPVFRGQRRIGGAVDPVVDHAVMVIDRNPDMAGVGRQSAFRTLRSVLVFTHHTLL